MSIALNEPVDNFELPATGDQTLSLDSLRGRNVVLYFYPKDSTPGCTTEGQDFRALHDEFAALDTVILGVSRDGIRSHENFKGKQGFPFELLSDKDESLCQQFDVIKEKKLYGRTVMGIERSTFLIDKKGRLHQQWRKVKVPGHAAEVLAAVQALSARSQT